MSIPGNQNAAKGKIWRSVIAKRLAERAALEKIADMLIDKALDGDMAAIKEVGDRTDGKAVQQIEAHITAHESALDDLK